MSEMLLSEEQIFCLEMLAINRKSPKTRWATIIAAEEMVQYGMSRLILTDAIRDFNKKFDQDWTRLVVIKWRG